jgi:hypothetical protein
MKSRHMKQTLSRSTAISFTPFLGRKIGDWEMKLLPALLTIALARPHLPSTKSRKRRTSPSFDTSAANVSALPPLFAMAAWVSSSLPGCARPARQWRQSARTCDRAPDAGAGPDHHDLAVEPIVSRCPPIIADAGVRHSAARTYPPYSLSVTSAPA